MYITNLFPRFPKPIVGIVFVVLVSIGAVIFTSSKYSEFVLNLEMMKADRSSDGAVYWDSGNGYSEFGKSQFSVKQSSSFETYSFKIPAVDLRSIRIDPLSEDGFFEIRSVTLKSETASYELRGDALCKGLTFINVTQTQACDGVFHGRATTNNPMLVIESIPKGVFLKSTATRLKYAFSGILATLTCIFLASWLRRKTFQYGILFGASALFFSVSVFKGWSGSLLDLFAFRQTQTAISVSYLLKGGNWFAYETPLFGPPWTVPFEFPLYQWFVAATVKLTGMAIDQSGRLISLLCFLLLLVVLANILTHLRFDKKVVLIVLSLTCLSPEYIFWSRTFMIESLGLTLSALYLLFYLKYEDSNTSERIKTQLLTAASTLGLLASVVKITTFFAFASLVFILFLVDSWKHFSSRKLDSISWTKLGLAAVGLFLLPLIGLILWTKYADSLKASNAFTAWLTSENLHSWTFGTWRQKLSLETWQVFYMRSVKDVLGSSPLLIVAGLGSLLCSKKYFWTAFVSFIFFIIPLTVFTNLHFVHSYYGYANGIFLLVTVGLVIAGLFDSEIDYKYFFGCCMLAFTIFSSVNHYWTNYRPLQGAPQTYEAMRLDVERLTSMSDVILVFGNDWSAEIPYYLERRAVMMSQHFDEPLKSGKAKLSTGYAIGAIAFCGNEKGRKIETLKYLQRVDISQYKNLIRYNNGCDVFYRTKIN